MATDEKEGQDMLRDEHSIHEGFCYSCQVWVNRPGELEAHLLETAKKS